MHGPSGHDEGRYQHASPLQRSAPRLDSSKRKADMLIFDEREKRMNARTIASRS